MASTFGNIPGIEPSVEGVFSHAWRILTTRFWLVVGLLLAVVLLAIPNYIVSFASEVLQERLQALAVVLWLGSVSYNLLVMTPAQYGLLRAYARLARGESASLDDVIAPFRSIEAYLSTLANALLLMLVYFAILSPVLLVACLAGCGAALTGAAAAGGTEEQAATAALAAVGVGLFAALALCAVPLIWAACRLMFAQVLVSDGGCGPVEAIRRSWTMTRGHAATIFLMLLVSIPISLIGLLAFCIGLIPAGAWILLATSSMYVALGGAGRLQAIPAQEPAAPSAGMPPPGLPPLPPPQG